MQGKIVGTRYRIIKFIGRGGFAETYLAEDMQMPIGAECVVKKFSPQVSDPQTLQAARDLFDREAQVLYQLGNHDQIPRLLAHFEEAGEFYLVEEFVDGDDLNKELRSVQRLTEEQVIALLQDVLGILAFVHHHHTIHRDIKPSNLIRRRRDNKIVLIDFGAVKQVRTQMVTAGGHTVQTVAIGTPGYMPNEQQGRKPRLNSDVYALGMTAIHALTGLSPDHLEEDLHTGEILWQSHATHANPKLVAVLDKMIRSHFRDRYQTIDEVLRDLPRLPGAVSSSFAPAKPPIWKAVLKPWYALALLAAVGITFGVYRLGFVNRSAGAAQIEAQVNQCYDHINAEAYDEALAVIEQAIQKQRTNPDVWACKGYALRQSQQYEQALDAYNQALAFNPDDQLRLTLLNARGITLESLDRLEQALASYDNAIALKADDPTAWNNRGWAFFNREKYDQAIADFERALEIDSNHIYALYGKGETRLYGLANTVQNAQDALATYQKLTTIDSRSARSWFGQGVAQYRLGQYAEARRSFEEATHLAPQNAEAWFALGNALEQLQLVNEANSAYEKAVALDPTFQEAVNARNQGTEL